METIELPEAERQALNALVEARSTYPEADHFEHDGTSVRMPGARQDVNLWISRETLRSLNHKRLIWFMDERDVFGHGRWTFDVRARAADYV
jgi:hypothetical protein